MDSKNYTQVLIDGKIYTLGGSEDEAYLQKAASYVNEKNAQMRRIPGFSKQNADYQMVMTQLNIADDYFKALEWAEGMERQKNDMEKETYSLKHELVSTQMKLEAVLKDLEERQKELDRLARTSAQLEGELKEAREELEEMRNSKIIHMEPVTRLQEASEFTIQTNAAPSSGASTDSAPSADASTDVPPPDAPPAANPIKPELVPGHETLQQSFMAESVLKSDASTKAKTMSVIEDVLKKETIPTIPSAKETIPTIPSTADSAQAPDSADGSPGEGTDTGAEETAAALQPDGISDAELARKALKAAKKANSHRGGRR